MILRTVDPREPSLRQWLKETAGDDAAFIEEWLWENHHTNYVEAMIELARGTQMHGKVYLQHFVEFARKPKEVTELEKHIIVWYNPRAEKAIATIMGHRGAKSVVEAEFRVLQDDLLSMLRRCFPNQTSTLLKSAMMKAFTHDEQSFHLDVPALVKLVRSRDPGILMASAD